jgi:hypothetical protein
LVLPGDDSEGPKPVGGSNTYMYVIIRIYANL